MPFVEDVSDDPPTYAVRIVRTDADGQTAEISWEGYELLAELLEGISTEADKRGWFRDEWTAPE